MPAHGAAYAKKVPRLPKNVQFKHGIKSAVPHNAILQMNRSSDPIHQLLLLVLLGKLPAPLIARR